MFYFNVLPSLCLSLENAIFSSSLEIYAKDEPCVFIYVIGPVYSLATGQPVQPCKTYMGSMHVHVIICTIAHNQYTLHLIYFPKYVRKGFGLK